MIIIRLLFIVSALFFLLVLGLSAALWMKVVLNVKNSLRQEEPKSRRPKSYDDGNVIQGEYKIIDETHKD